ncbi:uncharacterized protein DSM5745_00129 [Aspergillus mulundensis]|uniref:Uncharacterized protein n=1 Tax=Aspergillus mulundensis TaxID=1810919 RepID=A0A3D8T2L4_9EURO|nr:hypothetical protein DSM5745_00129 [Aspergillus mulundensis]RDW92807.1 hypothetical protein DSM5745_00129 [Aspergillus mulundensis]
MIVTGKEIFNPGVPDLPSKDQVVALCRQKGLDANHLTYTTAHGKIFFIKYNSVKMAEAHAQLVLSLSHQRKVPVLRILNCGTGQDHGTVDFSDEALLCYYGDIYRENFPVDRLGTLWVVDFDVTGVLQASFASWPLNTRYKHPLPIPIRRTPNEPDDFLSATK